MRGVFFIFMGDGVIRKNISKMLSWCYFKCVMKMSRVVGVDGFEFYWGRGEGCFYGWYICIIVIVVLKMLGFIK